MLSADDMGIKKGLLPFFCCVCGNRLGWTKENEELSYVSCQECSKED